MVWLHILLKHASLIFWAYFKQLDRIVDNIDPDHSFVLNGQEYQHHQRLKKKKKKKKKKGKKI
jgi:hypothetical protein